MVMVMVMANETLSPSTKRCLFLQFLGARLMFDVLVYVLLYSCTRSVLVYVIADDEAIVVLDVKPLRWSNDPVPHHWFC